MKKATKILLILAAVFLTAGIGFFAGGAAMGATLEGTEALGSLRGRYSRMIQRIWEELDEDGGENIRYDGANENGIYEFGQPIDEIDAELKYDVLTILSCEDDTVRVEVSGDPAGDIRVWQDGRELKIQSEDRKENRSVTLYLPGTISLKKLSLEVDAGTLEMHDDIRADQIDIQMGAGVFTNEGILAAERLEVEVGVGNVEISGLKADRIEGSCGTGSMFLELSGAEEDYDYKLKSGLGAIMIGENVYSTLGHDKDIKNPGASSVIELECGTGQISINFQG